MGFEHDIAGGNGKLVIAQLQSPNFNTANPMSSPSPSWAVLKNGLAYFFGLVLTGGTITGPDYIINTAGVFIYSGTPAAGNLIGSWAGTSGTDGFGNAYPQGFNITKGSISGSVFSGPDFIINSSGVFIYSGTPANGNLIGSWAGVAGTDAFGNAFPQGFKITQGSISGTTFSGTNFIISTIGVLLYTGTPALGNLLGSIAPTATTDSFGNTVRAGVTIYGTGGSAINMFVSGGFPVIFFVNGTATHATTTPELFSSVLNAGLVNEQQSLVLSSGKEGLDDAGLQLFSESADATIPAKLIVEFGGAIFATITRNGIVLPGNASTPPLVSSSVSIYGTAQGRLQVVDGADGQTYSTERISKFNSANSGSIGNALVTLYTSLVTTGTYRIHACLYVQSLSATAQFGVQLTLPAGATGGVGFNISRSNSYNVTVAGGVNGVVGAAAAMAVASGYLVLLDGTFTVTQSGTFSFQAESLVAGTSVVVQAFSSMDVMPV